MPTPRIRLALVVASLGLVGCGMPLETGAAQYFVRSQTCPRDRVAVVERPDLPPHVVLRGADAPPPADIAADPGRLALWNKQQADRNADIDDVAKTYRVTGCQQATTYICWHPSKYEIASTDAVGDATVNANGSLVSAVACKAAPR